MGRGVTPSVTKTRRWGDFAMCVYVCVCFVSTWSKSTTFQIPCAQRSNVCTAEYKRTLSFRGHTQAKYYPQEAQAAQHLGRAGRLCKRKGVPVHTIKIAEHLPKEPKSSKYVKKGTIKSVGVQL